MIVAAPKSAAAPPVSVALWRDEGGEQNSAYGPLRRPSYPNGEKFLHKGPMNGQRIR
jgi:hypothetical protein